MLYLFSQVPLTHVCLFFWNFAPCQRRGIIATMDCPECVAPNELLKAPRTARRDAVYRQMCLVQ